MHHGATGNLRKVWGLPDTRLCVCRSSSTTQQLGRHKTINRQWLTSTETAKLLNSKERLTVWLEESCASGLITLLLQLQCQERERSGLYLQTCSKGLRGSWRDWQWSSHEIQCLPSLWNTKRTCRPSVHTKRLDSIHLRFWPEMNRIRQN